MRPAYFILKIVLKYSLWAYYPILRIINRPKGYFKRTIYVSNHAASFMDPLVVGGNQSPIIFFMTRSDVFTPIMKPILWAAHMLPIYRSQDGEDTKKKNEKVFQVCYRILKYGRSLIIYGEGFTDDVFIRRLKPLKKGAVRIGFGALESMNWEKKIYIQTIGINYEDPNFVGSGVVISNGHPICLNDYKKQYLENPQKVISDLTHAIELDLRSQITDIRDEKWATIHEKIMRISKKGMHPIDSNKNISILKRREYSKRLASEFNNKDLNSNATMLQLRDELNHYFNLLDEKGVKEHILTEHLIGKSPSMFSKVKDLLLLPIVGLGLIHNYLPYRFVRNFVEKSFKRRVFWGSVKMTMGTLLIGLYNIVLLVIINHFVFYNSWLWTAYFFIVPPLTGIYTFNFFQRKKKEKELLTIQSKDIGELIEKRNTLREKIKQLFPF